MPGQALRHEARRWNGVDGRRGAPKAFFLPMLTVTFIVVGSAFWKLRRLLPRLAGSRLLGADGVVPWHERRDGGSGICSSGRML